MNLCTDQLAILLAKPGQLVSVSRIAADPLSSPVADDARGYQLNRGDAEQIYLMQPDLVLAGEFSDPVAIGLMRRLGIKVHQLPNSDRLSEIPAQIREVGALLGQMATAEVLAADVEARLAAFEGADRDRPVAAFFYANGYTLGAGSLSHDIITTAGFENLATQLGQGGGGRLSLESLIVSRPDVLIVSPPYAGASRAEDVPAHPALADYAAQARVVRSGPEWVCGSPDTIDAVEAMAEVRAALD
jgi:iron complex transport system substrate-binding protein